MNLLKPLPQIVVVFLKRLAFGFEVVVLDVVRSWNQKKTILLIVQPSSPLAHVDNNRFNRS